MLDQLPACVYQERLQWSSSASKYLVWLVGALSNRLSNAQEALLNRARNFVFDLKLLCWWHRWTLFGGERCVAREGRTGDKGGSLTPPYANTFGSIACHSFHLESNLLKSNPHMQLSPHFWTNDLLRALAPPHMIDSRGSLINCQLLSSSVSWYFLTEVRIWWFVTTLIRACNERAMHLHFKNSIPPSTKLQHLLKAAFIGILTGHSYLNQTPTSYKQQTSITTSCDSLFGV